MFLLKCILSVQQVLILSRTDSPDVAIFTYPSGEDGLIVIMIVCTEHISSRPRLGAWILSEFDGGIFLFLYSLLEFKAFNFAEEASNSAMIRGGEEASDSKVVRYLPLE